MERQIYNNLKKYYLNFNDKKYSELLHCKTEDELNSTFQKLWGKEHGGLFRIDNLEESFTPPEVLPYYNDKDNRIVVTDTGSNSTKFHKNYIKTLNNLILENSKDGILNLDFSTNFGGKPQVMMAGLLPIFNNFNISVLSYYYDRDNKRHFDVKRVDNKIICISNNGAESIGTKKKIKISEINIYFNNYTISSAEQSIICLLSLSDYIKINLIGDKSGGYTTSNKYFKLSDKYGLEIPIGYMGTKTKVFKKGVK